MIEEEKKYKGEFEWLFNLTDEDINEQSKTNNVIRVEHIDTGKIILDKINIMEQQLAELHKLKFTPIKELVKQDDLKAKMRDLILNSAPRTSKKNKKC